MVEFGERVLLNHYDNDIIIKFPFLRLTGRLKWFKLSSPLATSVWLQRNAQAEGKEEREKVLSSFSLEHIVYAFHI